MSALAQSWVCLACDEHGAGPDADRDAERHVKRTGHPTRSMAAPADG